MTKKQKTMTAVVKKLDKNMPVSEGATFDIGPETAKAWGVEPGPTRLVRMVETETEVWTGESNHVPPEPVEPVECSGCYTLRKMGFGRPCAAGCAPGSD